MSTGEPRIRMKTKEELAKLEEETREEKARDMAEWEECFATRDLSRLIEYYKKRCWTGSEMDHLLKVGDAIFDRNNTK